MRGRIIAFCGIDGAGKTTVLNQLSRTDVEKKSLLMKHPPKKWFSNPKIVAAYLDGPGEKISDEEEMIYTKQLREEEEQIVILPNLKSGRDLYYHRYIFSLFGYYRGIDKFSLSYLLQYFGSLLKPDQVFYLRISKEEFYRRFKKKEQLSYQKDESYIERYIECFDQLANLFGWEVIDSENHSIGECVTEINEKIKQLTVTDEIYRINGEIWNC